MRELRSCVRWQTVKPAKFKLEGDEDFQACGIQDINFKGMRFSLKNKLPIDSYFKINVVLAEEFILNLEVWVAWHKTEKENNVYGIYFNKISDSDREKIYKFVARDFPQELNNKWWGTNRGALAALGGRDMQSSAPEDRRIFARFPARFPLRFLNINTDKQGEAYTCDISAKGIGLVTNEVVPENADLEVWLDIPDELGPLYVRGRVAWTKESLNHEYRAGINLEKADLMGVSRALRAA